MEYTDRETVQRVQKRLIELGYVNADFAEGELGKKTQASVLDFRNRQNPPLPLIPIIDDEFLEALSRASTIEIPLRQATATADSIAPRVEAVQAASEAKSTSWYAKIFAWVSALGSLAITAIAEMIKQFDAATSLVFPLRTYLPEVPWQGWLLGFATVCVVLAFMAQRTHEKSAVAEEKMVEGYQKGTVKFDQEKATGIEPEGGEA